MKSITILKPTGTDNKTAIGASAFQKCIKLTSADLSRSTLTHLDTNTFGDDPELVTVKLPDATLNSIGTGAFVNCSKLSTINSTQKGEARIPKNVKSIAANAFKDDVCISKYTLSANTDTLDLSAFEITKMPTSEQIKKGEANPLKEFSVDENNPNYFSIDGVLYDKDPEDYMPKTLLIYPVMKTEETLEIPDTVEQIRSKGVSNNENLKTVKINEALEKFNTNSFMNCKGLIKVEFGKNNSVKFEKNSFAGLSGKPKLGFYAASGSTAQDYALANDKVIEFFDNNMKPATISIDQGKSVVYSKSTRFDLTVTLKTASGEKTKDMLSWSSSNINVVSVDNEGHCTTKNVEGTSTLTVRTEGGLSASIEVSVGQKTVTENMITLSQTSYAYDGAAKKPTVTVKDATVVLKAGIDYTIAYSNNTDAGTAEVTVTGAGRYRGTAKKTFKITAKAVSGTRITYTPDSFVYTGSAIKPTVTVKDGGKILTAGKDYTVSYADNINAGKATLKVTGKGNYAGTESRNFTIAAKSIANATVTAEPSSYSYDGKAKTPKVTVTDGNKVLTAGTDYTVSYKNNINIGTASVIVYGKGNYDKTTYAQTTFTIGKLSLKNATVTLSAASYKYDGAAKKPAVTVVYGSETLKNNIDYTVVYKNNVNAGTASVIVTGAGRFSSSITKTFTISAKSIAGAVVTLSPASAQYSGSAVKPAVTVTDGKKTLKNGTDYSVAYADNTKVGTATVTVTGKGNYAQSIKKAFKITAKPIADLTFTLSQTKFSYDGKEKTPKVTVTNGKIQLKEGTDYTLSYSNNVEGTQKAVVKVTAKGSYSGTKTLNFTIVDNDPSLFRLQGSRREFTATAISAKCYNKADTVIVTTGYDFHDALVSVPLAKAYNAPILLVHMSVLQDQVKDEITRLGAKNIIVVNTTGTKQSVGNAVISQLRTMGKVTTISTANYIQTAEKVAENLQARIKSSTGGKTAAPSEVFFVTNTAYADALSASPVAAIKGAPIIYIDPKAKNGELDASVNKYLASIKNSVKKVYLVGGTTAMPTAVEKKIRAALPSGEVTRFAGARRYETCILINNYFTNTDKVLTSKSLCVAKGLDFPDALAGGVYAAYVKAPLFLVDPVVNPDSKKAQIEYLKSKKAGKIIVFGGPAAVPEQVVNFVKNTK